MCLARKTIKTIFLILNCDKLNSHYIFETQKIVKLMKLVSFRCPKKKEEKISIEFQLLKCAQKAYRLKFPCLTVRAIHVFELSFQQVKSYFCRAFLNGRRILYVLYKSNPTSVLPSSTADAFLVCGLIFFLENGK